MKINAYINTSLKSLKFVMLVVVIVNSQVISIITKARKLILRFITKQIFLTALRSIKNYQHLITTQSGPQSSILQLLCLIERFILLCAVGCVIKNTRMFKCQICMRSITLGRMLWILLILFKFAYGMQRIPLKEYVNNFRKRDETLG